MKILTQIMVRFLNLERIINLNKPRMKSFLLVICSVFIFGFSGSKPSNFKIKNKQVIWQKVYDTDLTKKQLIEVMKLSGYFKDITIVNEKKLTARINRLSPDYKRYKHINVSTPAYLKEYQIKTFIVVEFKDKQFRVTLKSIKLIDNYYDGNSGRRIVIDIEQVVLNKNYKSFKKAFFKKPSKILDFTFQKITDFNNISEDDTW